MFAYCANLVYTESKPSCSSIHPQVVNDIAKHAYVLSNPEVLWGFAKRKRIDEESTSNEVRGAIVSPSCNKKEINAAKQVSPPTRLLQTIPFTNSVFQARSQIVLLIDMSRYVTKARIRRHLHDVIVGYRQ